MMMENIIRAISLIFIGIIIAFLSETITKSEEGLSKSKMREEEIREIKEKYEEAYNRVSLYKDLFTHDMNNILNIIKIGIELCLNFYENQESYSKLKKTSALVENQVSRGANLISNVRKLSQLEESEYSLEPIEISKKLKESIKNIKKTINERIINIQVDCIYDKLFIRANDLLEDVFDNILNNAFKHNDNSTVEINIRISKILENERSFIIMEFMDNGRGIDNLFKKNLFERGHKRDTRSKGMGLGLLLVKAILATYNSSITVKDKVEGDYMKGSNFLIKIPEIDQ